LRIKKLIEIFGPKRDKVTGEHVASMGEMRGAYRILVGRSEGKILLGRG
jgi:hypothetical protein